MPTAAERLAGFLPCTQCGKTLTDRACGPTHAILAADPTRHRLVMDALADALRETAGMPALGRVVLDPEDHDQVSLLNIRFHRGTSRSDVENMQAALREFLTDETREAADASVCPDKACAATGPEGCRYPMWMLCGHPVERPTRAAVFPPAQTPSGGDA